MGETGIFSTLVAELALVLSELGQFDQAVPLIEQSRTAAAAEDVLSHARWRVAMARVLASRGKPKEAVDLARQAVVLLEPTDVINVRADTLVQLAHVLAAAGEESEAARALEQALDLYERKGNVVSAGRAREMLTTLTP
jgi:tetratricopeptide (TPR) repeat protein